MNKNIIRINWNYNDNQEFNQYIDLFIKMTNQLGKDMSVYDGEYIVDTIQSIKNKIKTRWNDCNSKVFLYFTEEYDSIGYVHIMDSIYKNIHAGWISELFINASYRNKGYGTIIMKNVLDYFKEQKYQKVFLQVYEENRNAKALYDKFKFTTFSRILNLELNNFNTLPNY